MTTTTSPGVGCSRFQAASPVSTCELDGLGCDVVWTNPASAAVPKLSMVDGNINTVKRTLVGSTPKYLFGAIAFLTGDTMKEPITAVTGGP
jgi:hypothetical protein